MRHLVKRRDPKAVQKEREEREEREAHAAAAQASAAPVSEPGAAVELQAPAESAAEPGEEILIVGEEEEPVVLSPEEIEYIPPAIEEETSEV
jgi:small subunit ribosomal protein S6